MSRLDDVLGRLAAELEETEAPPQIEQAVMAEYDRVRRNKRGKVWISSVGAIAASVFVVWMVENRPMPKPAALPTIEAESEQPFTPIPYVLQPGPYERVEIVRMRLPVSALIAAGLPMRTADPGAQAEADVIVGQDGRPRAVRLISVTSFD